MSDSNSQSSGRLDPSQPGRGRLARGRGGRGRRGIVLIFVVVLLVLLTIMATSYLAAVRIDRPPNVGLGGGAAAGAGKFGLNDEQWLDNSFSAVQDDLKREIVSH